MNEKNLLALDLSDAHWAKSSFSAGGDNNCVEIAHLLSGNTAVRDSKNLGGPALVVSPGAWRLFLAHAQGGTFGR